MKIKIESTRPEFRRMLKQFRKSSILSGHIISHSNRIIELDFEDEIMQEVVREYLNTQEIVYEEL